jgi:hypothetical protein
MRVEASRSSGPGVAGFHPNGEKNKKSRTGFSRPALSVSAHAKLSGSVLSSHRFPFVGGYRVTGFTQKSPDGFPSGLLPRFVPGIMFWRQPVCW